MSSLTDSVWMVYEMINPNIASKSRDEKIIGFFPCSTTAYLFMAKYPQKLCDEAGRNFKVLLAREYKLFEFDEEWDRWSFRY